MQILKPITMTLLTCMTYTASFGIFKQRIRSFRVNGCLGQTGLALESATIPVNDFFRHWHCIGLSNSIIPGKPFATNIGELPLVVWRGQPSLATQNATIFTTINICKHMGSSLTDGKITTSGCLKCPYHGLEFSQNDTIGQTIEHEGKVFWAYRPYRSRPHSTPFYGDADYTTSHLQIDMDAPLIDSALNTMDIRHPEYVHSMGFGSNNPPQNIKHAIYRNPHHHINSVGLSFDYASNNIMRTLNDNVKITQNQHMYVYPTFSWSHVKFNQKSLIIGVNLLPLSPNRTRWFITIAHNYYKSDLGKTFMKALARTILNQDYVQMRKQAADSPLKRAMFFEHIFKDEEVVTQLYDMFQIYEYPDIHMAAELYKDYSSKTK